MPPSPVRACEMKPRQWAGADSSALHDHDFVFFFFVGRCERTTRPRGIRPGRSSLSHARLHVLPEGGPASVRSRRVGWLERVLKMCCSGRACRETKERNHTTFSHQWYDGWRQVRSASVVADAGLRLDSWCPDFCFFVFASGNLHIKKQHAPAHCSKAWLATLYCVWKLTTT